MTDIPQDAVDLATAAVEKQKRVDRLLRQQSKAEWFARVALEAAATVMVAAAEARGRKQAADEAFTEAARIADKVTNQGGVTDCACPNNNKRSCGWRAGSNEVAQVLYKRARGYAAEQDTPGGGDER